jgi:hypothetical protein
MEERKRDDDYFYNLQGQLYHPDANTAAIAKADIAKLKADPTFMSRYMHDDPKVRLAAIGELNDLSLKAFGNLPVPN